MPVDAQPPEDSEKGWKPDPLGASKLRWWDGEKWTDNVHTGEPEKKGKNRGQIGWIVGAVVTLLIIGAIASAGEDDGGDSPEPTPGADVSKPAKAPSNPKPVSTEPEFTTAQENAIESAQDYLDYSGFSRSGLISQLSSSAGEGFSKADAVFAVNHVDANWRAEAYEAARDYLDYSSFSLSGLIEQLSSSAGEGFTRAQAEYGAKKAYNGR